MLPEMLSGLSPTEAQPSPAKAPFSGVHYAKEKIQGGVLHGDKRGQTGEGEESSRIFLPPRGAPAAVHIYEDNGQIFGKHPQIVSRPHAYRVNGDYALATIEDEPKWADAKQRASQTAVQSGMDPKQAELVGRNEAEWALKSAGYDGYRSRGLPGNVVLFGNHPATDVSKLAKDGSGSTSSASLPSSGNVNPQTTSAAEPKPTFAAEYRFPMSGPTSHEAHDSGSDPANLQPMYMRNFGVVPKSSAEHELLSKTAV